LQTRRPKIIINQANSWYEILHRRSLTRRKWCWSPFDRCLFSWRDNRATYHETILGSLPLSVVVSVILC